MSNSADTATVLSLGGSVMTAGDGIDADFLRVFREVITERIPQRKFYIITGGGSTARTYQQALDEIGDPDDEELDWMGIHATRLNGQLLRLVFSDVANDELVLTPEAAKQATTPVVVGAAGATPGRSSDYGPLAIAEAVGADHVIELSDVSHIYSADPDTDPDATPFDPVSAEFAQSHDIEVAIMGGESVQNFTNYLDNDEFVGTTIANTYD